MNLKDAVAALARKQAAMKGIEEEYKRHAKERSELGARVRELVLADYANNGNEKPLECVKVYRRGGQPQVRIARDLSMWE